MDAIVTLLEEAGLIEVYTNEEGREAYRLTKKGEPITRVIATAEEDGQAGFDAWLDG